MVARGHQTLKRNSRCTSMRLRTSLLCPGSALALPAERLPGAGDASGACPTWEQTASP